MSLGKEMLNGAVEIHAHSGPDLFPRYSDNAQLAQEAKEYGFKGLVLKSQTMGSADRVPFIRQLVPDIDIFGALVLNYAVGGLNPFAVDAAIGFGARVIWMPTGDSRHHISFFRKSTGVNPMTKNADMPAFKRNAAGISIFDEGGKILPEVYDILDLVAKADVCFSLGHLSLPEMQALVPLAKSRGVKKIVIDHPNLFFTPIPLEQQKELVNQGVTMVYVYAELSPNFYSLSPKEMASRIKTLGADHVIMASDTGQVSNTPPAEAMRIFVDLMLENGITPEEIKKMISVNPSYMVYP